MNSEDCFYYIRVYAFDRDDVADICAAAVKYYDFFQVFKKALNENGESEWWIDTGEMQLSSCPTNESSPEHNDFVSFMNDISKWLTPNVDYRIEIFECSWDDLEANVVWTSES